MAPIRLAAALCIEAPSMVEATTDESNVNEMASYSKGRPGKREEM